jgi:hypothetical protein
VAVWSGGCLDGAGRDAVAVLWVGAWLRRIAEARRCCILAQRRHSALPSVLTQQRKKARGSARRPVRDTVDTGTADRAAPPPQLSTI